MDRLESMEVFVQVVALRSFAAAAASMGLSPAMVAKHVRGIEDRLGAPLLIRTTRRHTLTEIGRLYLERARATLEAFAGAEAAPAELQAEPRGTLRVCAPVVFGASGVAPLLGEFMARHPGLDVELSLNDRVVDLMEEGFDLAFRSGPLCDEWLVARPLRPLRMLLCASPEYLARRGRPRRPADLARHECLGFAHLAHPDRWRLVGPRGEERVAIRSRLVINNGEALRQAALAGAGIVMQSELLLADDLARGTLVRVLPRHAPPARPLHLVYPPQHRRLAKLQRFVAFAVERLGDMPAAASD